MSLERKDYMRNRGFVLMTDVSHRIMSDAGQIPITRLGAEENFTFSSAFRPNASGGALALIADQAVEQFRLMRNAPGFNRRYHITPEDRNPNVNKFTFRDGFGELDFTWQYAPVVANAVVQTFVEEGYMTQQQYDDMTFNDWAIMMRSRWFKDILHDEAITDNKVYDQFNSFPDEFNTGIYADKLMFPMRLINTPLFTVKSEYDEVDDQT